MGKKSKKGQSRANHQRKKKGSGQRRHNNNANAKKGDSTATEVKPIIETPEEVEVAPTVVKVEEETTPPVVSTKEETETVTVVQEESTTTKEEEKKEEVGGMPAGLEASLCLFPENQQKLAKALCEAPYNQSHLFAHWTLPSATKSASSDAVNDIKRSFMDQLEDLDSSMASSGGLLGYLDRAKALLNDSASGKNPLDGWTPSIPTGKTLTLATSDYQSYEASGAPLLGNCGFVLVAGGLGERLGYSNIKVRTSFHSCLFVCLPNYSPLSLFICVTINKYLKKYNFVSYNCSFWLLKICIYILDRLDYQQKWQQRYAIFNITLKLFWPIKTSLQRMEKNYHCAL